LLAYLKSKSLAWLTMESQAKVTNKQRLTLYESFLNCEKALVKGSSLGLCDRAPNALIAHVFIKVCLSTDTRYVHTKFKSKEICSYSLVTDAYLEKTSALAINDLSGHHRDILIP